MRFVETVAEAGCSREQTVAVFLDVEKAFDRVWHPGLLYKLTEILLPDCYLHLIARFLRNRTFRVRVDNTLSWKGLLLLVSLREASWAPCFSPVSYTHLDVYKRQVGITSWDRFR